MTRPDIEIKESPETLNLRTGGPLAAVREVRHSLFGTLLAPETPTDLATLLTAITQAVGAAGWRGQASLAWPIDSALARRVRKYPNEVPGHTNLSVAVSSAEKQLLDRARLSGHGQRDGRTLSDLELAAVLQHHGVATRLLDCTANAYVALWFACRTEPDEYGMLAAFDLHDAWHVRTSDDVTLSFPELLSKAESTFASWRPYALSSRIAAQQGIFVFSEAVDEPWGSVRFRGKTLDRTGAVPGLSLFAISPSLKEELRSVWGELFGYTEESLFPDLDGFARVHGVADPFPRDFY